MSTHSRLAHDAERIAAARTALQGRWDSSSEWFRGQLRANAGRTHIEPMSVALSEAHRHLSMLAELVGSAERMLD